MVWCEAHDVDHVFGCGQNIRLNALIARELERSRRRCLVSGKASRRYRDLRYRTRSSWSRERHARVAAGTARQERPLRGDEHLEEDATLRAAVLCPGAMENRIKDQQLRRASAHIMRASMYFSAFAGAIVRRVGLRGTACASTPSAPDCSSLPAGSTGRCAGSASVGPRPSPCRMCSPTPSSTCVPRPRRHPGSSGSIPSQTDASVSHRRRERCAWRTSRRAPEHQGSGFDPVNLPGSAETRHNPAGSSLKLSLDCRSGPKSGYHSPWRRMRVSGNTRVIAARHTTAVLIL